MNLNFLASVSQNFIDYVVKTVPAIELNWIGDIISWIIGIGGITGVGIILFTLILKTLVLPLDIFSRVSTKKQSLVMKKMRPKMEKLQKQYANDKSMYNQKVMELYKESGYSMLGACLPMIVSLVIFIVVISAFSTYSQYANLELYRGMVDAYNNSTKVFVLDEETNPEGFLIKNQNATEEENVQYFVDFSAFVNYYDNNDYKLKNKEGEDIEKSEKLFEGIFAVSDLQTEGFELSEVKENEALNIVKEYIREPAREAAANKYREDHEGFLWVNNIWYSDSMFTRELPDFNGFKAAVRSGNIDDDYENSYNEVTSNLQKEKENFNGFFILIVVAIGVMLLQQWLTMRSQKDANELSSVDGSAAQTNKMMMIIMPIMYGFFSFMYSASFSVYMITSSVYGLVTMLIINKIMDAKFAKQEAEEEIAKYTKRSAGSRYNKK